MPKVMFLRNIPTTEKDLFKGRVGERGENMTRVIRAFLRLYARETEDGLRTKIDAESRAIRADEKAKRQKAIRNRPRKVRDRRKSRRRQTEGAA